MSTSSYAEINGLKMYYEIHGEGEPLLLIHGGSATVESFQNQIPVLAAEFQVIAADSRGHGRTGDAPGPITYAGMAEDFVALIRHLKLPKVSVVGWSDGGIIGLHLAMHYPELIHKLVTFGSNYHFNGNTKEFKEAVERSESKDHPAFLITLYESLSPDGPEHWPVFFGKLKEMWLTSPVYELKELQDIKAPTMICVGDQDIVRMEHTVEMFQTIPGAQLCVIPGSSHFMPWEKFHIINPILLEFLRPAPPALEGEIDLGVAPKPDSSKN